MLNRVCADLLVEVDREALGLGEAYHWLRQFGSRFESQGCLLIVALFVPRAVVSLARSVVGSIAWVSGMARAPLSVHDRDYVAGAKSLIAQKLISGDLRTDDLPHPERMAQASLESVEARLLMWTLALGLGAVLFSQDQIREIGRTLMDWFQEVVQTGEYPLGPVVLAMLLFVYSLSLVNMFRELHVCVAVIHAVECIE